MVEQTTLFEPAQPVLTPKPKVTCRKCKHIYKHDYGKMLYCRKQWSSRTSYNNKKIKAGDPACAMFEKRGPTKKMHIMYEN